MDFVAPSLRHWHPTIWPESQIYDLTAEALDVTVFDCYSEPFTSQKRGPTVWEFENPPYYSHPLIENQIQPLYDASYSDRFYPMRAAETVLVVENSPTVVSPAWIDDLSKVVTAPGLNHVEKDYCLGHVSGTSSTWVPRSTFEPPLEILTLDLNRLRDSIDGCDSLSTLTMIHYLLEKAMVDSPATVECEQPAPSQPQHHKNASFRQNRRRVPSLAASRKPTALPLRQ